MRYFEKQSKKKEDSDAGIYPGRLMHALPVPFLRGYLGTKKEMREAHPVVSAVFGPGGAYGAKAKDTGKSYLGEAAIGGAVVGPAVGASLGATSDYFLKRRLKNMEALPMLRKDRAALRKLKGTLLTPKRLAIAAAIGIPTGAVLSTMGYGLGHMFGKNYSKKTPEYMK